MRSFALLFALLLPFLSHAIESELNAEPETGTIIGRVAQAFVSEVYGVDDTIGNATVMLRGTPLGAMTDSTGVFVISSVPMGNYELSPSAIGYASSFVSVQVTCDDTVDVGDIFLSPGYPCPIHYFIWPRFETVREIDIELIFDSMLHNREDLVQFYYRYTCLPSTRNGNIYRICLSDSSLSFQCKVAGYRELNINLDGESDRNGVYSINLDSLLTHSPRCTEESLFDHIPDFTHHESPDQWITDDYSAVHEYVNITLYGDRDLVDWGYIGHRLFYDDNDERSILLVYHNRAVSLRSGCEPQIFNFEFPVKRFYVSDNYRYLFVLESVGYRFQGGDAQLIDTYSGESICFDPTPENPEPDRAVGQEGSFSIRGSVWFWPFYLVANNGSLVRIDDESIHFYDVDYTVASIIQTDEIPLYLYNARLSQDGDSLLVIGLYDDKKYVAVMFDVHGRMRRMVDLESNEDQFPNCAISISPDLTQVLLYQSRSSQQNYTRLFTTTGQILYEWNEWFWDMLFSESGNLLCLNSNHTENRYVDVFSIDTLSTVLTIPNNHHLETRQDLTIISRILGISDNGYFIVQLFSEMDNAMDLQPIRSAYNDGIAIRLALFDVTGNIIWLSPCFNFDQFPNRFSISSDGLSLSYMEGIFLHTITFERHNHIIEE